VDPTAISTLARRFPERKGLVLSLHAWAVTSATPSRPSCVGALLATLSWREVVIMNVVPAPDLAPHLSSSSERCASLAEERETAIDYRDAGPARLFRGVPELFRNRGLILLSNEPPRSLETQNALLISCRCISAYEMGYSPFWSGRVHVRAADRGLRRCARRRGTCRTAWAARAS